MTLLEYEKDAQNDSDEDDVNSRILDYYPGFRNMTNKQLMEVLADYHEGEEDSDEDE